MVLNLTFKLVQNLTFKPLKLVQNLTSQRIYIYRYGDIWWHLLIYVYISLSFSSFSVSASVCSQGRHATVRDRYEFVSYVGATVQRPKGAKNTGGANPLIGGGKTRNRHFAIFRENHLLSTTDTSTVVQTKHRFHNPEWRGSYHWQHNYC